jgi:cell migration-inducing and hyaluronan-binding protein
MIPAGRRILLDVSPPVLRSLTIEGTLQFDERDLSLTAGWIMVHGTLQVGSEARPYRKRAVITLDGPATDDVMGMGARFLGVMGGTLELHGEPRLGWTRLDASAAAGGTSLTLAVNADWRPGDRIVIASTDLDPFQAEEAQVASVQGRTVTLAQPLRYNHWGTLQTFAGRTMDERAEVGLLTRNITIRSDSATNVSGLGGHIMVMQGGAVHLEGVELFQMGQKAKLARYPLHWHLSGDVSGQYLRNSTVWKSFNRCVTIHGTNKATLRDNVCYDHIGHGFFQEDGAETGNVLERNLGLVSRAPAGGQALLPSDATPATFWITNPDNTYRGNVAAGSRGFGFWFALPDRPTGLSSGAALFPRRTPLGEFTDNVAHSNRNTGLQVDQGPKPDGSTETVSYRPRENPAAESPAVLATFRNFIGYKHGGRAVWLRGQDLRLANPTLADNAIGATFAASATFVEDGLFVGQSGNAGGSQLAAGFPVRGYEFYDGLVGAHRSTFVNYVPVAGRPMSALGYNRSNAFNVNTGNHAQEITLVNANAVYLEDPKVDKDGDRSAVFLDVDGSVTGGAGHFVVANNPLLATPACVRKPAWNAFDCPNRFVRVSVRGVNGELIGPADVQREDGPMATYVGAGGDPTSISLSLPANMRYTIRSRATVALRPQVFALGLAPTDWVQVTIPYAGSATPKVYRDYDTSKSLLVAATRAELDASVGDRFYHDSAAGMLQLKLMAKPGRDYAVLYVAP